jgi:hypothetical protein
LELHASSRRKGRLLFETRSNKFFEIEVSVSLWTESGRPTLCVLMNCKCEACGSAFLANDGRILHQPDPHVHEPCEVEPKHAEGTFHFNMDLTDNLESLMKTHVNGRHMGKNMLRKLGLKCERKIASYLSQFGRISPVMRPVEPPSFEAFSRGFVPTDSASIRNLHGSFTAFQAMEGALRSFPKKKDQTRASHCARDRTVDCHVKRQER